MPCLECSNLCLSSQSDNVLISLKEYSKRVLFCTSDSLNLLCSNFEIHFKACTQSVLPLPNPRASLVLSFLKERDLSTYNLNCSNDQVLTLVRHILGTYCTCRIFYHVRLFSRGLADKIKGKELREDEKLNR